LAEAYCKLFEGDDGKVKDTISIRKSLMELNEDQIDSTPEFF